MITLGSTNGGHPKKHKPEMSCISFFLKSRFFSSLPTIDHHDTLCQSVLNTYNYKTMRLPPSLLLTTIGLIIFSFHQVSANSWECDIRCGKDAFDRCMREKKEAEKVAKYNATKAKNENTRRRHLRPGRKLPDEKNNYGNSKRKDTAADDEGVQIKMYWREGFCWQEEYSKERRWCWTCWGDWPHCDENDKVEIKWCDEWNEAQRWVYKPASDEYGRISPAMNQTLCFQLLEHTSILRLLPCDEGNRRQLFSGWSGPSPRKFELHPYGQKDKCLTQEHDPKNYEEIISVDCSTARGDHTNAWGLLRNSSEYLSPTPKLIRDRDDEDMCILDLDLSSDLAVYNGKPFRSPDHPNVYVEQQWNGNLVIRDGSEILWESGVSERTGNYFTKLQSDGNMLTFRGQLGDDWDDLVQVWKSESSSEARNGYFLGLSCDASFVAIFGGTPNDRQEMIWAERTFYSSGFPLSHPRYKAEWEAPSFSPSASPTMFPTVTSVPSESPTSEPTTEEEASCNRAYYLGLRQHKVIREGWIFHSPDDDSLQLEQWSNGNLCVRHDGRKIWESQEYKWKGEWYTKLRADGNIVTYPGTPDDTTGSRIWESHSWTSNDRFFLGLDCERKYVAVFGGTRENPGEIIWKSPTYTY